MSTLPETAEPARFPRIGPVPGLGSRFRDGLASLLLFGLAVDWFLPLLTISEWTQRHLTVPLLVAFALFLLPEAVGWRGLGGWIFRVLALFGVVGHLFYDAFPALPWLSEYRDTLLGDLEAVRQGQYESVGPETRTLLFLGGWMLLISSVQAIVLWRKKALWLVAAGAVYLLGLQLWLGIDTSAGLMRSAAIGLMLAALLRLPEIQQRFGLTGRRAGWPAAWLAVCGLLTAGTLGTAWALARPLPAMPVPATITVPPALESLAERWGMTGPSAVPVQLRLSASASRTGYGDNDFRLGGPVSPDDGIAFLARTPVPVYWRGEAKTVYDGKGWIQVERELISGQVGGPLAGPDEPAVSNADGPITQEVWLHDRKLGRLLFAAGPVMKVESAVNERGEAMSQAAIRYFPSSGKSRVETGDHELAYYRVRAIVPATSERLREGGAAGPAGHEMPSPGESAPGMSSSDFRDELQLPETLPPRVRELAHSIVQGQSGDLAKALELERYLRATYTYSMDKPKYPEENTDFVDRFLFEEKLGYCDHFSTAMAVMLRAVGIPSRWVKGFAPGETDISGDSADSGDSSAARTVIVRNKHAHSWVEAYIAPHGWISFEPTPGFTGFNRPVSSPEPASVLASNPALAAAVPATVTDSVLGSAWGQSTPDAVNAPAVSASDAAAPAPDGPGGAGVVASAREGGRKLLESLRELARTLLDGFRAANPIARFGVLVLLAALPLIFLGLWRGLAAGRDALYRLPPVGLRGLAGKHVRSDVLLTRLDRLWLRIFRRFGGRSPQQTLREYAAVLSGRSGWTDRRRLALAEFVGLYETVRYGAAGAGHLDRRRIAELWRILSAEERSESVGEGEA